MKNISNIFQVVVYNTTIEGKNRFWGRPGSRFAADASGDAPSVIGFISRRHGNIYLSSSGVALVLVMVCLLALSGLVLSSAKLAYVESEDVVRLREEYQADLLAESGLELAKMLLEYDIDSASDTLEEPWTMPIEKDNLRVTIDPCNSRLELNKIIGSERSRVGLQRMLYRLLLSQRGEPVDKHFSPGSFEFTRAAGQTIRLQDWIDPDSDERVSGSETKDYEGEWLWDKPLNGNLNVPEEASMVKFWHTVPIDWIRDNCTTFVGTEQVNINFATQEVFHGLLPEIDHAWEQVLAYRESSGFTDVSQLRTAVPDLASNDTLYTDLVKFVTVKSDLLQVTVEVELPLVYQKRRYILQRLEEGFEVKRGDVLEVRQR